MWATEFGQCALAICLVFDCSLHARVDFAVCIMHSTPQGKLFRACSLQYSWQLLQRIVPEVFHLHAGNGSNIASAHESNNEYSEGPSANQENSGLSTGCADLGLQLSSAAKLNAPTVRIPHTPTILCVRIN